MAAILETTGSQAATTGTTLTIANYTAPAGSVLVVSVMCALPSLSITSVTYNGVTLDQLADLANDGSGVVETWLFMAVTGPDGSPHDLVVTFSGSIAGNVAHVIASSWSAVANSSVAAAHRTVYTDGTAAGDLNVTVVDSENGDTVVQGVGNWGTNVAAGQTQIVLASNVSGTVYDHLLQHTNASGASTPMSVTGGQLGETWAMALVPLPPLTAGIGAIGEPIVARSTF